jgi:hypothetical protein
VAGLAPAAQYLAADSLFPDLAQNGPLTSERRLKTLTMLA